MTLDTDLPELAKSADTVVDLSMARTARFAFDAAEYEATTS